MATNCEYRSPFICLATSWEFVPDLLECILYAKHLYHLWAFGQTLQFVFVNSQPDLPEETDGYRDEHILIEDGAYVIKLLLSAKL